MTTLVETRPSTHVGTGARDADQAPPPVVLPVLVAVLLWGALAGSPFIGVPQRAAAVGALGAMALIVALTRRSEAVRLPGGWVVNVGRVVLLVSALGGLLLGARWTGVLDVPYVRLSDLPVDPPPGSLLTVFTLLTGGALGWLLTAPSVPARDTVRPRLLTACSPGDLSELLGLPDLSRFDLVGSFDADAQEGGVSTTAQLPRVCAETGARVVVVGREQLADARTFADLRQLQAAGVQVRLVSDFIEEFCRRVPLERIEPRWFMFDVAHLRARRLRLVTLLVDVLFAVAAVLLLLLLGPLIAVAVKASSAGPVLYRQARVGQFGRVFDIVKFRTMTVDAEEGGARQAEDSDPRVTAVGRFLRRSRLDELPQAWNLLRREMSLIGPRPERPEFVAHYSDVIPWYTQRQLLRPGLTGWAQVTEGYTSDVAGTVRKLERDLYYLKYRTAALDLAILAATAQSFLRLGGR